MRGRIPSNLQDLKITSAIKDSRSIILPSNLKIIQIDIPLIAVNMHIQLKPYYFENQDPNTQRSLLIQRLTTEMWGTGSKNLLSGQTIDSFQILTRIDIGRDDDRDTRNLSSDFNPTLQQGGQIIDYDFDRYIRLGLLDSAALIEQKFKFSIFNSSLLISNIYFFEDNPNNVPSNSLIQMHNAPFKWLRLLNCSFNLTNQLAFHNDGVNTEVQNCMIDISRQNAILQIKGTNVCPFYQIEGIGNNLILNRVIFTGKNKLGYNRIMVVHKPLNITITNCDFLDTQWNPEAFGIVSGYSEIIPLCTSQNQYFIDIFENNTYKNSIQTLSNIPFQIWLSIPNNPYIFNLIRIRNNVFENLSYNKMGLLQFNKQEYINTQIYIENNYFANISSINTDVPMLIAQGEYVSVKNNTVINSQIPTILQFSAWNGTINSFNITNLSGISSKFDFKTLMLQIYIGSGVSGSFLTIQNSRQVAINDIIIQNCIFNSVRALQLISSNQTSITNLSISKSEVSTNHIIYLSHVYDTNIKNSFIGYIRRKNSLQSDLRVLKIGNIEPYETEQINHLNISQFTYIESQMPFFDLLGTQGKNKEAKEIENNEIVKPGEVSIRISNSFFEGIQLSEKLRFFTTQNLNFRGIVLEIYDSVFQNNILEKGFMFEFKHNFRLTVFSRNKIEGNKAYFLEMTPLETKQLDLYQRVLFIDSTFQNNTVMNNGMMHVTKNAELQVENCLFTDNYSFGRGSILYSEFKDSRSYIKNSFFLRNSALQGGVIYIQSTALVNIINCTFSYNFAFQGGVAFLQNDGNLNIIDSIFKNNFAMRASLFYLFNSQSSLSMIGGLIQNNGFIYHPTLKIEMLVIEENKEPSKILQETFSRNQHFIEFLNLKKNELRQFAQRDQQTDNPQIQLIKATLNMEGGIIIQDQISLMSIQSLSNVQFSNVSICNITDMKSPLIFLDQSIFQVSRGGLSLKNTSIVDNPVIDVQSDSEFICNNCKITNQQGQFINVRDSKLEIINSTLSNLSFTEDDISLIRVQSSTLIINGTDLRNISFNSIAPSLSVFKLRDTQLFINQFQASLFTINLIHAFNSQIQVNRSTFMNATNLKVNGLVFNLEESNINISWSKFSNLVAHSGSAIKVEQIHHSPQEKLIKLEYNTFDFVNSTLGGTFYSIDTNAAIQKNTFRHNSAGEKGGCLYLICGRSNGKQCNFEVQNNQFFNNSAKVSGGAIYFDSIQPQGIMNNNFSQNNASYGPDTGSFPTKLKIMNNDTNWSKEFASGRNLNTTINIGLFDQNNQLYNIDSQSECRMFTDDVNISLSGNTKVKAENGVFQFTLVNLVAKPSYSSFVKFESSAIENVSRALDNPKASISRNLDSQIYLQINFRQCLPGEVTQNTKCVPCMRGTYSVDPLKTTCDHCINKATCPGGSDIVLNNGKWRNISNNRDIKIYDCLIEEACKGGLYSECADGYEGIFCSRCSNNFNNKTYARTSNYKCSECKPFWNQILLLTLFMLLMRALFAIYILYNLFQNPKRNKPQTVLIRIFTNYFQIVSLVYGFDLQWPSTVYSFLNSFVKISDSQESLYSLDCIFIQMGFKNRIQQLTSSYYIQVIIMGLIPIFMSILSIPIWLLINLISSKKFGQGQAENQQRLETIKNQKQQQQKQSSPQQTSRNLNQNFSTRDNANKDSQNYSGIKNQQKEESLNFSNKSKVTIQNYQTNNKKNLSQNNEIQYSNEEEEEKDNEYQQRKDPQNSLQNNQEVSSPTQKIKVTVNPYNNNNGGMNHQDITNIIEQQSHSQIMDVTVEQIAPMCENLNGETIGQNRVPEFQHNNQVKHTQTIQDNNSTFINNESTFGQKLMATFFVIVLLWHPTIINYSFSLFMCQNYEDGFSYLKKDTTIRCWQGKDLFFQVIIATIFLALWAVIFPITIYWRISQEKGRLSHPNNLKLYGIFYIGLNDDTFYWEIIVVNIRKIAIIVVATFFNNSKSSVKGYVGILAIFMQRHFSHYQMPFIDPRFNEIENLASISSILILFGGLILLPEDDNQLGFSKGKTSSLDPENELFKTGIIVLVLIFNIYFIIKWAYNFINVLVRIHFPKFQRFCICLKLKEGQVDDYEKNLQNWRNMQEQTLKFAQNNDQIDQRKDGVRLLHQAIRDNQACNTIDHKGGNRTQFNKIIPDPYKVNGGEKTLISSINQVQPGEQVNRDSESKQYIPDSGRGFLEEYSISDSLVDYSRPLDQLAQKRKQKKEPKPLKLSDWLANYAKNSQNIDNYQENDGIYESYINYQSGSNFFKKPQDSQPQSLSSFNYGQRVSKVSNQTSVFSQVQYLNTPKQHQNLNNPHSSFEIIMNSAAGANSKSFKQNSASPERSIGSHSHPQSIMKQTKELQQLSPEEAFHQPQLFKQDDTEEEQYQEKDRKPRYQKQQQSTSQIVTKDKSYSGVGIQRQLTGFVKSKNNHQRPTTAKVKKFGNNQKQKDNIQYESASD